MTPWMTFEDAPLVHALGWALLHLSWVALLAGFATRRILQVVPGRFSVRRYRIALTMLVGVAAVVPVAVVTMLVAWQHTAFAGAPLVSVALDPARATLLQQADVLLGRSYNLVDPLVPFIVVCWILGAAWSACRLIAAQGRVRDLVATASPAPRGLGERIVVLAARLGRPAAVRCGLTDRVAVPTVAGAVTPWILLPRDTLRGLDCEQVDALLVHELAHVWRCDPMINWCQCVVEALCFFHPSVIQISMLVRREREFCCDDVVVEAGSDPRTYAHALTRLEVSRSRERQLALAATDGALVTRVRRLIRPSHRPGHRERWRASASACMAILALLTALPLVAASFASASTLPPALRVLAYPIFIDGEDPAGRFSVTLHRHHVVNAIVDGVVIPPGRVVQRGDSVRLLSPDGGAVLAVKLMPRGHISWTARQPQAGSTPRQPN